MRRAKRNEPLWLMRRSLINALLLAFIGTVADPGGVLERWWLTFKPLGLLYRMLTGSTLLLVAIDLVGFFAIVSGGTTTSLSQAAAA